MVDVGREDRLEAHLCEEGSAGSSTPLSSMINRRSPFEDIAVSARYLKALEF